MLAKICFLTPDARRLLPCASDNHGKLNLNFLQACLPPQAPFSIGGSGSTYIYALCDKIWRPQMTEEEAKAFVIR